MKTTYTNLKPEYKAFDNLNGRAHPMVLIAATGMTIFSLLGSAAITGLIPVNQHDPMHDSGELSGILSEKAVILPLPVPEISGLQIKPQESRHERTSDSVNSEHGKEFLKSRAVKPLVLT